MTKKEVLDLIITELRRAETKFPWWPADPVHAAGIVCEEASELMQAALDVYLRGRPFNEFRKEAVSVGAMAVRLLLHRDDYIRQPSEDVCCARRGEAQTNR